MSPCPACPCPISSSKSSSSSNMCPLLSMQAQRGAAAEDSSSRHHEKFMQATAALAERYGASYISSPVFSTPLNGTKLREKADDVAS
eukprot:1153748-Pelagomonas_calceolata.AAC.1